MAIDGKSLLLGLRNQLGESDSSEFMDDRLSYDLIYQAAMEFIGRTRSLTTEQSITTVAEQTSYTLNANHMELWLRNNDGEYYIKYNDGTDTSFLLFKEYEEIYYANQTDSVSVPDNFTILDDAKDTRISSSATSAGAVSEGESILTDSTAPFADASPGDIVHNTTDGSDGIVLSKTSSSVLVTALFGGTNNDWSDSDNYIIQPQARVKLLFDPPPSTSGHTVTVPYVQKPAPVFSSYGIYRVQEQHMQALIFYASWLYKYRDREKNYGDSYYQYFELQVKKAAKRLGRTFRRGGQAKVFLRGRNHGRSYSG